MLPATIPPERMRYTKLLTVYAAAGAISVVGWILNVQQLYWMAGVLLVLPLASRLFARLECRGVTVRRHTPPAAYQGEVVSVRFHVHNSLRIPKLHLAVADCLPRGLKALDPEPLPVDLTPQGETTVAYDLQLNRRGLHELREARIVGTDPLGLSQAEVRVPATSRVMVYPRLADLPPGLLPRDWAGGNALLEATREKGEGTSFFGTREYRPGDPLRHVHWKTAARQGRLAVVEWEQDQSRDLVIAVDTRAGSPAALPNGDTLDLAAGLAGSLARAVLAQGDAVRLLAPGATEWAPSADRGVEALPRMLEALARMQAEWPTAVSNELRHVAPWLSRNTLVYWLTADAGEDTLAEAAFLRAAGLRLMICALVGDEPAHRSAWERTRSALESQGFPTVTFTSADRFVQELLD